MKIHMVEVVTRYQVTFSPQETAILMRDGRWQSILSTKATDNNGRKQCGMANLTKTQIAAACDVLGINAREWFASDGAATHRGRRSRYRAGRGAAAPTGLGEPWRGRTANGLPIYRPDG